MQPQTWLHVPRHHSVAGWFIMCVHPSDRDAPSTVATFVRSFDQCTTRARPQKQQRQHGHREGTNSAERHPVRFCVHKVFSPSTPFLSLKRHLAKELPLPRFYISPATRELLKLAPPGDADAAAPVFCKLLSGDVFRGRRDALTPRRPTIGQTTYTGRGMTT